MRSNSSLPISESSRIGNHARRSYKVPMMRRKQSQLPEDLGRVAGYLEENAYEPTPLDLDQLKLRTMAHAQSSSRRKGFPMRSKLVPMLLVLGLTLGGGAAGVIAGGGGHGHGSAAKSEYRPGKGCGARNHTHTGPPGNPSNNQCPPNAGPKK